MAFRCELTRTSSKSVGQIAYYEVAVLGTLQSAFEYLRACEVTILSSSGSRNSKRPARRLWPRRTNSIVGLLSRSLCSS